MSVKPIVYSSTVVTGEVNKADVLNNLTIKDADGTRLGAIETWVDVAFENNSDKLVVKQGETYKATIKAKTNVTPNDSKNIINDRVVEFTVVGNDLSAASFKNEAIIKDATYAGTQITYGITKDNLKEKLGDLQITENGKTRTLIPNDGSKDPEYDMNVVFGENTNVGVATITINGLGTYAGTQKVITFDIKPAEAEVLTVPAKTLFKEANRYAEDYNLDVVVTTKEFTDANGNKQTLTVPASDYVVTQKFVEANGDGVAENAVLDKIETKVAGSTTASGNFVIKADAKETLIVNKAITDADVVLEKTEYTYNADRVVPEYKVVVDGVTLEKDKDFTEYVSHNTHVGEATLKITGKGDYDSTTSVIKKFTIVAANVADVKVAVKKDATVEYTGRQHVGDNTTENLVFTIDGNVIDHKELTALYPTSKAANINAGDGEVTLVPNKNAEYKNFVGEGNFTFTISPATLTGGELKAYDKNGTKVAISTPVTYDGTAHTFVSTVYTNKVDAPKVLTENDYEIIYKDNVVGDKDGNGHILVVAKGNYANTTEYKCADGSVVKNVVLNETFKIEKLNIAKATATVENGAYAEGYDVEPVVKVAYEGKELVNGVDYKFEFVKSQDRTEVTNGKTLTVTIRGIGGYKGWIADKTWGIDKFDLANAEVIVTGTDAEPVVKVINSGKVVSADEYDLVAAEGKVTITAKETSKHYTGVKVVDIKAALEKPVAPMIERVEVAGNKATVILSGESEAAIGYDYVISTDRDCITNKDYDKVNKNKLTTDTTFQYVEQGMYYAYCHAWTRDENGKKVFSDWSNAYPFSITAITPSQPTITSVKQKGSTVTVTYTESKDATGYDVVLGSAMATVNNERRPVDYGTLVVKNATTTTVTFKNVPAGKYYVGLHSYNRTSEDSKKVFSPWSVAKTFTVK